MSNFDKQWLQKKIADMEVTRDEIPFGLDEDDSNTLAALRIALASLEADGTLANEGAITATKFKPVADLYGLTSPTGGETSFTFDAVEARDFIDGGWSCQEYVELERFQEAVIGNSPVITDGWVACSERMPEREVDVQVYCSDKKEQMVGYMERNERNGYFRFASLPNGGGVYCQPTHWMPLPAAPQQEAKNV